MPNRLLVLNFVLWASLSSHAAAPKLDKHQLQFARHKRTYHLVVPPGLNEPAPLLIVLHGRGGSGENMAFIWRPTAAKDHFIVAAPKSLKDGWDLKNDPPEFFRQIIQDVSRGQQVDPRRIYLFGFSSGGWQAMALSLVDAHTYAAAVAMAGAVSEKNPLLDRAQRKVPLELLIGSEDYPEEFRSLRDALRWRGFPVKYGEIKGLGHVYNSDMPQVNDIVWEFLAPYSLPR